jgi:hypothetical protein
MDFEKDELADFINCSIGRLDAALFVNFFVEFIEPPLNGIEVTLPKQR